METCFQCIRILFPPGADYFRSLDKVHRGAIGQQSHPNALNIRRFYLRPTKNPNFSVRAHIQILYGFVSGFPERTPSEMDRIFRHPLFAQKALEAEKVVICPIY